MSENISSAAQDHWKEIAESLRTQLSKVVPLASAMTPSESKDFLYCLREVDAMEMDAATFDGRLAKYAAKQERTWEHIQE